MRSAIAESERKARAARGFDEHASSIVTPERFAQGMMFETYLR